MYGNRFNNKPPVEEGQEIDVTIESIGDKGDGVAKVNGFVVFVPDVQKGENVRIKISKVLSKVSFGEVVSRNEAAPAKEQPKPEPKDEFAVDVDEENDSEDFGEDLDEDKN